MNISLNPYIPANRAVGVDFGQLHNSDAVAPKHDEVGGLNGPSLVVTDKVPDIAVESSEYENYDLVRDDRLGELVKSAFDLKPPEVPDFV